MQIKVLITLQIPILTNIDLILSVLLQKENKTLKVYKIKRNTLLN